MGLGESGNLEWVWVDRATWNGFGWTGQLGLGLGWPGNLEWELSCTGIRSGLDLARQLAMDDTRPLWLDMVHMM